MEIGGVIPYHIISGLGVIVKVNVVGRVKGTGKSRRFDGFENIYTAFGRFAVNSVLILVHKDNALFFGDISHLGKTLHNLAAPFFNGVTLRQIKAEGAQALGI